MPSRGSERQLAYEGIVEEIKEQVFAGILKPGDRLPTIAERAREANLSPGTVREAYRVLQSRGLLEVVQGRGTFIAEGLSSPLDALQVLDSTGQPTRAHLLEARRLLEPRVARLAAERASRAERDAIVRALDREESGALDVKAWVRHNMTFHALVAHAAHNPVASEMLRAIYAFFEKTEPHPAEDPLVREKGRHFHRLIAIAISEGDSAGAEALMDQHISSVERMVAESPPPSTPGTREEPE